MPPISTAQAGDLLAIWLGKNSADAAVLKQIAADIGYKDSPWIGAEKRRVRLVGEVVMANCALVIFGVNQVFTGQDSKRIVDAFLASARKSVFSLLEAKDKDFKQRYEQRLKAYFEALGGDKPGIAVSFIFMKSLDIDPIKNGQGQLLLAARLGQALSGITAVLKTLTLAATGADAISQLQAMATADPARATAERRATSSSRPFFKNESREDFKQWFANVQPWNRLDARLVDVLINSFHGNPMFEVFVHVSQSSNLVPRFLPLGVLFDQGIGEIAALPRIAGVLLEAGQSHREALIRLLTTRTLDQRRLQQHYGQALDAFESALIAEPSALPCYLELALLKLAVGRKDDARRFCERGLDAVEALQRVLSDKPRITKTRTGHSIEEVRQRLKALWDEQLVDT